MDYPPERNSRIDKTRIRFFSKPIGLASSERLSNQAIDTYQPFETFKPIDRPQKKRGSTCRPRLASASQRPVYGPNEIDFRGSDWSSSLTINPDHRSLLDCLNRMVRLTKNKRSHQVGTHNAAELDTAKFDEQVLPDGQCSHDGCHLNFPWADKRKNADSQGICPDRFRQKENNHHEKGNVDQCLATRRMPDCDS